MIHSADGRQTVDWDMITRMEENSSIRHPATKQRRMDRVKVDLRGVM
jgi:hypothetical protein